MSPSRPRLLSMLVRIDSYTVLLLEFYRWAGAGGLEKS